MNKTLLKIENLRKEFKLKRPWLEALFKKETPTVKAVDDVSFEIKRGETLGIVGESGSGKTTMGRSILRLIEPTSGKIIFDGYDLLGLSKNNLRKARKDFQIIFQDPMASLNPYMKIGKIVSHPLEIHNIGSKTEQKERVLSIFEKVNLIPAKEFFNRYPKQLSGGQRQRVVIARALITNPKFIVADEPTAMLDVSVRSQILKLMIDIKEEFGLTYLFITHDLASAKYICDRIGVMYLGKIVEMANTYDLFTNPLHPYTQILMSAVPIPDPNIKRKKLMPKGEIPSATKIPKGCRFHPRCPFAKDICKEQEPKLKDVGGRFVACHLIDES
ncbi:ABC transporter ATP-binding protein [Hippea maritima]|uniref:Oligopeptide/dipeptide ABC transporter, ATPase subunit n=1 Tax=Hippea maritima (strain ATCC 700847 / DSM 10411 / MH2) TaxID=760142 RepID=F2LXA8_HIPMA|nr:oligopeptide/dipeptide ABC transporter ATP-binding protein [Hippea maritima]AEA34222.1 oligopeptide/dipeptide ABC transporter, ATPase subunit [Hippea maritima DSM 10411]